jgi:hypothetical protein
MRAERVIISVHMSQFVDLYKSLTRDLLDTSPEPFEENTVCLSLYLGIPGDDKDRQSVLTRIKASIEKAFAEYSGKVNKEVIKAVTENVKDIAKDINKWDQGIAIFTQFDPSDNSQKRFKDITKILNTPIAFDRQSYIGEIYDLSKLLYATQNDPHTLIVNVKREATHFYDLYAGKLSKWFKVENKKIYTEEYEYLEALSLDRSQELYFSTGGLKAQKEFDKFDHEFFNRINYITKRVVRNFDFEFISFYHSSLFEEETQVLKDQLVNIVDEPVVVQNINLESPEKIKSHTRELFEEYREDFVNTLMNLEEESQDLYSSDIQKILDAYKQDRISTVYIAQCCSVDGYISKDQELFLDNVPTEELQKTNLIPWLVRYALLKGDGAYVFKDMKKKLIAKFRY